MRWRRALARSAVASAVLILAPSVIHAAPASGMGDSEVPAVSAGAVSQAEVQDLTRRVTALERIVGRTRVGGWIDFIFYADDKPGTDPFFDLHHFYLYFDNRFSEHWQAFAEMELEHSPRFEGSEASGQFKLDRAFIQYNYADAARLRAGKFNSPSGYWTPVHWAINVDTNQKPIHEDNYYVPPKAVGLEFFGTWFPEMGRYDATVEYAGYWSNGSEIFGTNEPEDGLYGGGLDLRTEINDWMMGFSYYTQRNPSPTVGTADRQEHTMTAYGNFEVIPSLTLRFEYQHQLRGAGDKDISVWYAKGRWDFLDNAYLNYRYNEGDDDKRNGGMNHAVHTATLGYRPVAAVRLRVEYNHHKLEMASNFDTYTIFIGYVF